jgi:flagellar motor switch protein FliG
VELNDATLKRIFAAADPQILLLALTGAEDRLVQRILKQLPAADAAAVRQRLNHPGPLRLSDVDSAQQQLAQLAVELHELGVIRLSFLSATTHLSLQS